MFPDTIPSPKAAETFEAALRQFDLPEVPASLDARMQLLLSAPPVAARMPERGFWQKPAPWATLASLAAGVAVALLLRPHTAPPATATAPVIASAATPSAEIPKTEAPAARLQEPVLDYAIPVGYQYQGSRTLYGEEMPMGSVRQADGTPMRAWQRKSMLRHTYTDPKTHATIEVDAPRETVVLEDLPSY